MKSFKDVVLGTVGNTPLTLDDLLFHLKTDFKQTVLDDTIYAIVLRAVAQDLGITTTVADLQTAADAFRKANGLITAQETHEWLAEHGLTVDEFERKIDDELLRQRVQEKVTPDDKQRKVFAENILDFERVKIAKIVVNSAGLANEVKSQIDEGEADFAGLATKYSVDKESGERGGFVGYVNRKDLPGALDVAVFADKAPEIVGPVEAGGQWHLIKILEPKKASFDDPATQMTCRKVLFDEFMGGKMRERKVQIDFLPA